eukprot:scaffold124713_cov36-Phaeocystis_antarctica.AAC.2
MRRACGGRAAQAQGGAERCRAVQGACHSTCRHPSCSADSACPAAPCAPAAPRAAAAPPLRRSGRSGRGGLGRGSPGRCARAGSPPAAVPAPVPALRALRGWDDGGGGRRGVGAGRVLVRTS